MKLVVVLIIVGLHSNKKNSIIDFLTMLNLFYICYWVNYTVQCIKRDNQI